jgi:hypothetical protein
MAGNRLHTALGAIGVLAWTLYLLGCGWTAWSPDGRQVLALRQGVHEVSAFSVDVRAGTTKLLASVSPADESFTSGQWDRSGKRVLLVRAVPKRGSSVLVVPVGASAPTRELLIDHGDTAEPARFPPPYPQLGAELFVPGGKLQRVNLDTGAIASRKGFGGDKAGAVLFQRGERVGYVAFLENEVAVGEVDRTDLSLRKGYGVPWTALGFEGASSADAPEPLVASSTGAMEPEAASSTQARPTTQARSNIEAIPFVAAATSGDLVAFTILGKGSGPDRIVVLGRSGVERILTPSLPARHLLGNLQWSRDGRTLYAAVLGPSEEEGVVQFSAALIAAQDAGAPRLIPVARLRVPEARGDDQGGWPYALQISLSPDGRALAASTGFMFAERRGGAVVPMLEPIGGPAVHIVNLEKGTVRRIPLPPPPDDPAVGKKGRG